MRRSVAPTGVGDRSSSADPVMLVAVTDLRSTPGSSTTVFVHGSATLTSVCSAPCCIGVDHRDQIDELASAGHPVGDRARGGRGDAASARARRRAAALAVGSGVTVVTVSGVSGAGGGGGEPTAWRRRARADVVGAGWLVVAGGPTVVDTEPLSPPPRMTTVQITATSRIAPGHAGDPDPSAVDRLVVLVVVLVVVVVVEVVVARLGRSRRSAARLVVAVALADRGRPFRRRRPDALGIRRSGSGEYGECAVYDLFMQLSRGRCRADDRADAIGTDVTDEVDALGALVTVRTRFG